MADRDIVVFDLGINNDSDADLVANLRYMVDNVYRSHPQTQIIVMPTKAGSSYCEGYGENYGLHATHSAEDGIERIKRQHAKIVTDFASYVRNRRLIIAAAHLMLDRRRVYPMALANPSAYVTDQELRVTNAFHPSAAGYHQWGDALACAILGAEHTVW
jgi:lysophospholipase L1-like esterase